MIAEISPITVSQEIAAIRNSIRAFIGAPQQVDVAFWCGSLLGNTGEIAASKFSHHVASHRRAKFLKSRRPAVECGYGGKQIESVRHFPRGRGVGLRRSHGLLGIARRAGAVSVFLVYRITGAVTAGANRPVMTESKPAADQGELRLVVVPRGQAVSGMVHARQMTGRTAIAPDRAVNPKKQKVHAEKVSAPVTTVEDASAELMPLN